MINPSTSAARALLLSLLFLCACGAPSAVSTDRRQQRLIGGADDDGDAAVVLLRVRTWNGDEGSCTGTVIGRHTVLTAAHCLAPQAVGRDAAFSIFLGPDFRDAAARSTPGLTLDVARVEFDPEFEADLLHRGHDIGVVFTAVPIGIATVALSREQLSAQVAEVRLVGYGLSAAADVEGVTAGRRRQARVPVQGVRGALVDVGTAALGPCLGDSGGPALLGEGAGAPERLVGLVSYSPRSCDGGALLTAISAYLPLIDGWLVGEDLPPPEPRGCSVTGRERLSARGPGPWPWPLLFAALLACARKRSRGRPPFSSEGAARSSLRRADAD